jgi:nucleotide-binding universal stress UspA family protein
MNKVITCIDGSIYSDDVCNAGIWVSKKLNKSIIFLHALEKNHVSVVDDLSGTIGFGANATLLNEMASLDAHRSKIALKVGKEMLNHAVNIAKENDCENVEQTQRHSDIVEAIQDLEQDARFIVIGRSGKSHDHSFKAIGSHIEQVIRQVHTPVLITNRDFTYPKSFMFAYDGRETADKAVKRIIEGGLLHNLTCHLVTVKNGQKDILEKFNQTKSMLIDSGFDVKSSFIEGNIYNVLMDYKSQHNVEMLVMGAFSHSKLAHAFLGSNTLKMIENTNLPLIILR